MAKRFNNIRIYLGCFIVLSCGLSFMAYFNSSEFVKLHAQLFYTAHFVLILAIVPLLKEKMLFVLSPSFLALAYTYCTFILGAWAFNHEAIIWKQDLANFKTWQHFNTAMSFFILCGTLILVSYFLIKKPLEQKQEEAKKIPPAKQTILLILAIASFFFFSIVKLDVTELGGLGDYSIIPKTLAALMLISILALNRSRFRYLCYLITLITFAAFSFNDKREAVLLILCIFLEEAIADTTLKLNFKKIVLTLVAFSVVLYLILTMSILRGYGRVKTKSFVMAFVSVPKYIVQSDFLPAFLQNIEAPISFYHSHQAIEFIEKDRSLLTYGSTLAKFIFVPVPGSWIKKPKSIIAHYTGYFDKSAYLENVSWPINFCSELYWNFGYWGWFLIPPFFIFFNKLYFVLIRILHQKKILSGLILLYMYQYFIFFIRGSGLDLYFFYLIFSSIVYTICFLIPYSALAAVARKKPPFHAT